MGLPKKYTWYKIADSIEGLHFPENNMMEIKAGEKTICLINHKGSLVGCAAKCPHAGGTMAVGYIDPLGNIVCPLHRYKFNLQNGRNVSGEGYFLKTFPIEIRPEGIFAGIEEKNNFFGW